MNSSSDDQNDIEKTFWEKYKGTAFKDMLSTENTKIEFIENWFL